jgi:hypothetical protein
MSQERTATCACGKLRVTVSGEPTRVGICNCTQCQKRTGSAFGVGAYFKKNQLVKVEGSAATFKRGSDAGRNLETKFCPECGSTVNWSADFRPDHFGVAVGCFADPQFPAPNGVSWVQHKLLWARFPDGVPEYERQPS